MPTEYETFQISPTLPIHNQKDLTILIPCYNEEGSVGPTIEGIIQVFDTENMSYEILCINNNSSDRTENVLKQYADRYTSVRYKNTLPIQGFGIAVRHGLQDCNSKAVIIVMADGSELPAEVLKFYIKFEEGYDCVFGSRFLGDNAVDGYPKFKLFLNRFGNNFLALITASRYSDFTSSFKCYNLEKLNSLGPFISNGFNLNIEMSLKYYLSGAEFAVVGNSWKERDSGTSKFKLIKECVMFMATSAQILWKHLITKIKSNN